MSTSWDSDIENLWIWSRSTCLTEPQIVRKVFQHPGPFKQFSLHCKRPKCPFLHFEYASKTVRWWPTKPSCLLDSVEERFVHFKMLCRYSGGRVFDLAVNGTKDACAQKQGGGVHVVDVKFKLCYNA